MSLRNIRKVFGDPQRNLPPPDEEDEEYEPTYTKKVTNNFNLLGLESSSSHSDEEKTTDVENVEASETGIGQKKKKKKKKKQRKNKISKKQSVVIAKSEELDEIDKSLLEVEALLGPAPPPSPLLEKPTQPDPALLVMAVHPKFLNANEEMNRLFGPDEDDPNYKKRVRQSHVKILKRCIVLPEVEEGRAIHFMSGLYMSMVRQEGDISYFAFEHNREMQKLHSALLIGRRGRWADPNMMPIALDDVTNSHVEGLLDTIDALFMIEQNALANNLVEQALGHMQRCTMNPFNVCNPKNRLEYKYRENRPFHILILKYMYLVTNRACHRTALELAKVLLNLDPSDPLGVLMVIDVMALRAREHQWLLDAINIWKDERNADFLFNIKYSKAVSQFHVTTKEMGDLSLADDLIQEAIYAYPTVAMRLFECASIPIEAKIKAHPLFSEDTTKNLGELMMLYAKLCWSRWKEGQVMNWLKRNVLAAVKKYDGDESIRAAVLKLKNKRLNLFRSWPKEIMRHLSIIKPMAGLLVDGSFPDIVRACSFNPLPPVDSIDRCHYDRPQSTVDRNSIIYEVFASLMPPRPPGDENEMDVNEDEYDRVMPELSWHNIDVYIRGLLDNEEVPLENPQRNALMNSAGDVRNTLMLFLDEVFENALHNDQQTAEEEPQANDQNGANEANDQNEN